ncbi:uncharacterized protein [Antedon mediterranea]|uniref:uncharacterized protein n=1 Tax=Antedon mediterranea TaxID=105859 RepID=UPI003AF59F2F
MPKLGVLLTFMLSARISSTAKTIEIGPNKEQLCGQTISLDEGWLISSFSQLRDLKINCIVTILAQPDYLFQLDFIAYKLPAETPHLCDNIHLNIYDGPTVSSLQLQPLPSCTEGKPTSLPAPVVTSGNSFTFSLRYDGQVRSQEPIDVQIHFSSWKKNIKVKDLPKPTGHAHKIAFIVLETITGLSITAVILVGIVIFLCRNCRPKPEYEPPLVAREISSPTHGGHSYFSNTDNQVLLRGPPPPTGRAPPAPHDQHHHGHSLPPPHRVQSFYPSSALHPSLTRVKVLPVPRQAHGTVAYDIGNELVYMNR